MRALAPENEKPPARLVDCYYNIRKNFILIYNKSMLKRIRENTEVKRLNPLINEGLTDEEVLIRKKNNKK